MYVLRWFRVAFAHVGLLPKRRWAAAKAWWNKVLQKRGGTRWNKFGEQKHVGGPADPERASKAECEPRCEQQL
jgi:hypothetical protein